jgi:hypothetical protein
MGKLQGFLVTRPLNSVKKFHGLATPFLRANIGTYRDGEGCGITISGYAPSAAFGSWGEFLEISTEGQ